MTASDEATAVIGHLDALQASLSVAWAGARKAGNFYKAAQLILWPTARRSSWRRRANRCWRRSTAARMSPTCSLGWFA